MYCRCESAIAILEATAGGLDGDAAAALRAVCEAWTVPCLLRGAEGVLLNALVDLTAVVWGAATAKGWGHLNAPAAAALEQVLWPTTTALDCASVAAGITGHLRFARVEPLTQVQHAEPAATARCVTALERQPQTLLEFKAVHPHTCVFTTLDKKGREDVIARIRERLKGMETAVVLYRCDPAKYRESADEAPAPCVEAAMAAIGDSNPDSKDLSAADSDHADALSVLVAEACVRTYGNTPWKRLLGKNGVVQRLVDCIDDRALRPFGIIDLLREADQAEVRLALQEAHATLSRCANKAAVVQRLRRMIRDVFTAVLRAQGDHAYEAAVLRTSSYRKDVNNVGRVVLLQALRGSDAAVDLFLSGTPMTNTAAIYVANIINAEPKRPDPRALCVTLPSGAEMWTHGEDAVVLFDTEGNVMGRTGVRTEKGDRDVEWKDLLKQGMLEKLSRKAFNSKRSGEVAICFCNGSKLAQALGVPHGSVAAVRPGQLAAAKVINAALFDVLAHSAGQVLFWPEVRHLAFGGTAARTGLAEYTRSYTAAEGLAVKLSALERENNAGKGLVAVIERLHAERHPDELSTASGLVDFAANLLDRVAEGVIEALLAMPAFKETKLKAVLQQPGANRFACVARCVDYAETLQNVNGSGAMQTHCRILVDPEVYQAFGGDVWAWAGGAFRAMHPSFGDAAAREMVTKLFECVPIDAAAVPLAWLLYIVACVLPNFRAKDVAPPTLPRATECVAAIPDTHATKVLKWLENALKEHDKALFPMFGMIGHVLQDKVLAHEAEVVAGAWASAFEAALRAGGREDAFDAEGIQDDRLAPGHESEAQRYLNFITLFPRDAARLMKGDEESRPARGATVAYVHAGAQRLSYTLVRECCVTFARGMILLSRAGSDEQADKQGQRMIAACALLAKNAVELAFVHVKPYKVAATLECMRFLMTIDVAGAAIETFVQTVEVMVHVDHYTALMILQDCAPGQWPNALRTSLLVSKAEEVLGLNETDDLRRLSPRLLALPAPLLTALCDAYIGQIYNVANPPCFGMFQLEELVYILGQMTSGPRILKALTALPIHDWADEAAQEVFSAFLSIRVAFVEECHLLALLNAVRVREGRRGGRVFDLVSELAAKFKRAEHAEEVHNYENIAFAVAFAMYYEHVTFDQGYAVVKDHAVGGWATAIEAIKQARKSTTKSLGEVFEHVMRQAGSASFPSFELPDAALLERASAVCDQWRPKTAAGLGTWGDLRTAEELAHLNQGRTICRIRVDGDAVLIKWRKGRRTDWVEVRVDAPVPLVEGLASNQDDPNRRRVKLDLHANLLRAVREGDVLKAEEAVGSILFHRGRALKGLELDKIKTGTTFAAREAMMKEQSVAILAELGFFNYLNVGYYPRETQLIALLLAAHSETGILQQLLTGEGKSLIIQHWAGLLAVMGGSVDALTSNRDLAEKGVEEAQPFLQLLGLKTATNATPGMSQAQLRDAYRCNVVFGDVASFQRDVLNDDYLLKPPVMGDRRTAREPCIIMDECDSLKLDKAKNMLYIAHKDSTLQRLEGLMLKIWSMAIGCRYETATLTAWRLCAAMKPPP